MERVRAFRVSPGQSSPKSCTINAPRTLFRAKNAMNLQPIRFQSLANSRPFLVFLGLLSNSFIFKTLRTPDLRCRLFSIDCKLQGGAILHFQKQMYGTPVPPIRFSGTY